MILLNQQENSGCSRDFRYTHFHYRSGASIHEGNIAKGQVSTVNNSPHLKVAQKKQVAHSRFEQPALLGAIPDKFPKFGQNRQFFVEIFPENMT